MLAKAGALGLGGIYGRDDVGTTRLGRLDAVLIFEALAKAWLMISAYISIHNMCVWMIDRFGTQVQRQTGCPQLVGLQNRTSYCLTKPGEGSDAGALTTQVERDGDGWVLNWQKQFISGARLWRPILPRRAMQ